MRADKDQSTRCPVDVGHYGWKARIIIPRDKHSTRSFFPRRMQECVGPEDYINKWKGTL